MRQFFPSPALQPYIRSYLLVGSEQGMVNRILPDTALVIAFRLQGEVRYVDQDTTYTFPQTTISGIRQSSRMVDYAQHTANLLVTFKEGGAAAFFKTPLHELGSLSIALDQLIAPTKVQQVEEQLAAATGHQRRIRIVEGFLLSELKNTSPDLLVQEAVQQIKTAKGDIRINTLLTGLHLSRDAFEKRFRKITGTTPKHFATIVRLKALIGSYTGAHTLTQAAYSAGYYDQAHFIKDFRAFTGQTPHDFFKTPRMW